MGRLRPWRGASIGQLPDQGKLVGLFGGSFDPPHCGHVALVRAGLTLLGLDEVRVIPAWPVHRRLYADADARLAMVRAVFADWPQVVVSDCEIARGRPVAAIETLRQWGEEHPGSVPWLMLGADAWAGLPGWREYPQHLQWCNIAVFARAGAPMVEHPAWKPCRAGDMRNAPGPGHVVRVDAALPDISATRIREACRQGGSLAGLVPAVIEDRVRQLYAEHQAR